MTSKNERLERTGVVAFWKGYDRKKILDAAILADELGYDSFWVPETWGYDAFPLLTEMAKHTKQIKLGTSIVNVFSRSPALIAMSAATLDEISEGRTLLGIGTSGPDVIQGFHGRPFRKPLSQTRDVIRVVQTLLEGKSLTEAQAVLDDYRPFRMGMEPVRNRVPIYVAALKEKSIQSIGELADGWMPTFWPIKHLDRGEKWLREGAERSGRCRADIDVAPITIAIPIGNRMGSKQAREIIALYVGGMGDFYRELLSGFGFKEECDEITRLWADKRTRGKARKAVTDEMIDAMTIAGTPGQCITKLANRRDYGMDLPVLALPINASEWVNEAYLRTFAPRW